MRQVTVLTFDAKGRATSVRGTVPVDVVFAFPWRAAADRWTWGIALEATGKGRTPQGLYVNLRNVSPVPAGTPPEWTFETELRNATGAIVPVNDEYVRSSSVREASSPFGSIDPGEAVAYWFSFESLYRQLEPGGYQLQVRYSDPADGVTYTSNTVGFDVPSSR